MWKETVRMLRPGYTPPDRKEIGGKLLGQVHENLTSKMKTELSGKDVVMMKDGWSDIHNTPVIAISLHTDGATFSSQLLKREQTRRLLPTAHQ